jgi:copper chaperone
MATTVLKVGGMSCQGCVKSVTQVLQELNGVDRAEVSLEQGEATVAFDDASLSRDDLARAVIDAGFEAS